MMRAVIFLISILFAVVAGQGLNEWTECRSDADGFLIEMPGTPKTSSRELSEGQTQRFWTIEIGSETYLASVVQLNPGRVPANPGQEYFDTLIRAYTDGSKTTLQSSRLFNWAGRAAIEGIAEMDGMTHIIDVTTAGDRIYLVVHAGPKGEATTAKATRMRDSFKLLGK